MDRHTFRDAISTADVKQPATCPFVIVVKSLTPRRKLGWLTNCSPWATYCRDNSKLPTPTVKLTPPAVFGKY